MVEAGLTGMAKLKERLQREGYSPEEQRYWGSFYLGMPLNSPSGFEKLLVVDPKMAVRGIPSYLNGTCRLTPTKDLLNHVFDVYDVLKGPELKAEGIDLEKELGKKGFFVKETPGESVSVYFRGKTFTKCI
ncbi:MAG: hypothetical protein JW727_05525 [Candidatus Aenigmarchaeota archaeon]|nr:hypothetical protein [Candidatus Aenigmarchaeota archaeon]